MASTRPLSRRERPAKPALSLEGIVATAMRVMNRDGLERVTMRRIAEELDTGPASLYVYVANAAQLHGAMFDELLEAVNLPTRVTPRSWRTAVLQMLLTYTSVLLEQPSLARSILTFRPSGPRYLEVVDRLLDALRVGGIPPHAASWGIDLLLQQETPTAAEHGSTGRADRQDAGSDDQWDALVAAVAAATPAERPGIAWAGEHLLSGPGHERLTWGFERILDGITPRPDADR